jgi:hypothetical protein
MSTIKEIIAAQKAAEEQSSSQKKATAQKVATAQAAETKSRGKQASASEAEQVVFLAASTAGSELLQALGQVRRGAISEKEAEKKLNAFRGSISALRAINPSRADAVQKSVLPENVDLTTTITKPKPLGNYALSTGTATAATSTKDTLTKTPLPSSGGKTKPAPQVPTETPTVTPGGGFTDSQNAARLEAAGQNPTGVKSSLDTLLQKTEFWFDLPDYIFKLDPKLGELLVQAVDEGWDPNTVAGRTKFLNAAALTPWWQKNAEPIRKRIIDQAKAKELQAAGEDISKTDYGLYMAKKVRSVKAQAKEAGATLDDAQATAIADKIYNGFLDDDPLAINALIVPYIGKVSSIVGNGLGGTSLTGFSGQALKDYQTLQGIAKANGFTLKDILPNISAVTAGGDMETSVLRGLADGSLDINRISQDARMLAAQGQPQYVRGLLSQGYDLQDIYAPYRSTMAATLEIDPNTIDLNDPTLRGAITDKGDMNMYDFKKALRQDSRWQYTGSAKEEVSNAALGVLRDFGFQG